MAARSSVNVTLKPELEKFIQDRIAAGQYQSGSEIVQKGLLLLEQQEREADAEILAMKAKFKKASDQADRGEFVTVEHVMERIATSKQLKRQERDLQSDLIALKTKLLAAAEESEHGELFIPEQARQGVAELKRFRAQKAF